MINEQDCTKTLNSGEVKYTNDEIKLIRDFMVAMATIEYENFKNV